MGEPYRTMAEIEERYPNEWVVLDKPTARRPSATVTGGVVVGHSSDRGDFDQLLFALPPEMKHIAVLHTGRDHLEVIETGLLIFEPDL